MPRKPRAASCIVTSLSTNFTNQYRGLWITDALLAETFHNFCHSPRRYGSNVPGPLEARRRASKRKNTSLAYNAGGGQTVYDPAIMLGSGPKDQWWTKVDRDSPNARKGHGKENVETAAPSLLPEWLFKSPAIPPTSNRIHRQMLLDEELSEPKATPNFGNLEAIFAERIERTTTLEMILIVVKNMGINLRLYPKLSQIAFRHLVEIARKDGKYSKLGCALYDPSLHPPGSSNHIFLLRHFCSNGTAQKMWETDIWPSFLKAVELGLISASDLQEIIRIVPDLLDHGIRVHAEWHRIFTAMEQSRVLHLHDLGKDFLASWFRQIANARQTDATCFLLWKLRGYSGRSELELGSELTVRRLKAIINTQAEAVTELTIWLANIAPALRGPVVIQATFRMISTVQHNEPLAGRILERWSSILPQLGSTEMLKLSINKATWSEASGVSCSLTPPEQLLSVIWIAVRLWASHPDQASYFATANLRDEFESTFTNMADVEQFDHVSRVVLTLDELPLPQKDQIFPFLQHFTDESLIKMLGYGQYLDGLKACFRLEYAQLKDNTFAWVARYKYPEVLRSFAESVNMDLTQFQAMAQSLILKNKSNFTIVKRLLDYNMDLKFALSQSWPSSVSGLKGREPQFESRPRLILAMVEKLIMAYAVTPTISPRASLKRVREMYLFLHKCGAPVNPIVGRALWHAGVTRYGQTGAPKTQIMWCLSRVREIEGEEAAERLLWSAGFRRSFLKVVADQWARDPFSTEPAHEIKANVISDEEKALSRTAPDTSDSSSTCSLNGVQEGQIAYRRVRV